MSGSDGHPDGSREVPLSERPLWIRVLSIKLFETRWSPIRRAYAGDALAERRLRERRWAIEIGRFAVWFHALLFLPVVAWILLAFASMGSRAFWQIFWIVVPVALGPPALGIAFSRLLDARNLRSLKKQTIFLDARRPPGFWFRHVYLPFAIVVFLLGLVLALFPPQQFLQNLRDLSFLFGIVLAALGSGMVSRACFSFEGDDIVCAACGEPAPVAAGDVCAGCGRDLSELESRSMGRRVTRWGLLLAGVPFFPLATLVFLF